MSEFAGSPVDVEHSTTMAVEEKKKLQKSLRRFDMLFFTVCALVGLDTLGQVSSWGAQTFTWLIVLAVLFVLPYALLMAELGSAFTQEGGPYEWMKLSLGPILGRHRRPPLLGHEPALGRRFAGVHLDRRRGAATSPRSAPARSATTSSRWSSSGSASPSPSSRCDAASGSPMSARSSASRCWRSSRSPS